MLNQSEIEISAIESTNPKAQGVIVVGKFQIHALSGILPPSRFSDGECEVKRIIWQKLYGQLDELVRMLIDDALVNAPKERLHRTTELTDKIRKLLEVPK